MPPASVAGSEPGYWLGTDSLGREVLSRLIHDHRIALIAAFPASGVMALPSSLLEQLAGFLGGRTDRVIGVGMSFPPVLFAILLVAVPGTGQQSVVIAIAVIDWTRFARVIRSETLVQAHRDYVAIAEVVGRLRLGILAVEVFPYVLPTILVLLSLG